MASVTTKKTLHLPVDSEAIDSAASTASLTRAAEILRRGGTVAFPTETVYGLGANALDEAAVQAIFVAKQRPAWDPLIVHVVSEEQLQLVASDIPRNGRLLMQAFWPGPLTLLLPKSPRIPPGLE
jgi:L-threonylcarbamoyladenylate synthase